MVYTLLRLIRISRLIKYAHTCRAMAEICDSVATIADHNKRSRAPQPEEDDN